MDDDDVFASIDVDMLASQGSSSTPAVAVPAATKDPVSDIMGMSKEEMAQIFDDFPVDDATTKQVSKKKRARADTAAGSDDEEDENEDDHVFKGDDWFSIAEQIDKNLSAIPEGTISNLKRLSRREC
jgi:hypothetical protein